MRATRGASEIEVSGKKLREAPLAKGFSAQALAEMADVTAQQIRRYENGKAEPGAILLYRIVRALETPYASGKPMSGVFSPQHLEI